MQIEKIKQYLKKYYLSLEALAEKASVTPDRIIELVGNQCIPPHSHELQETVVLNSGFVAGQASELKRYYHPSLVRWISKAETLAKNHSLTDIASMVRSQFDKDYEQYFQHQWTPNCENLSQAWRFLMTGLWGVCLKDISMENMAKKQLARLTVAKLRQENPNGPVTPEQASKLISAVEDYESVTLEFSPTWHHQSSRVTEIEAALKHYGIRQRL